MRKGTTHTEATKARLREARSHQVPWNKGVKTGPRPAAVRQRISESLMGHPDHVPVEKKATWRRAISESKKGHVQSDDTRRKRSASMSRAYAEGRKTVKPASGYGKGRHYESPFQGSVWLRSTSEVQRAEELDAEGVVWFYEVRRFPVRMGDRVTTYRPDFWIIPGLVREDVPIDYRGFLLSLPVERVRVEDVKGWWKPSHKTFPKIQAFQQQYPDIRFEIVIREGQR